MAISATMCPHFVGNGADRRTTEARCEEPIIASRNAAALEVTQCQRARFLPSDVLISRAIGSHRPPSRRDSPGSESPISETRPPFGNAPSATTTMEKCRPARSPT